MVHQILLAMQPNANSLFPELIDCIFWLHLILGWPYDWIIANWYKILCVPFVSPVYKILLICVPSCYFFLMIGLDGDDFEKSCVKKAEHPSVGSLNDQMEEIALPSYAPTHDRRGNNKVLLCWVIACLDPFITKLLDVY